MGYDVSFHPISPEEMREWYFTPLTWIQQGQEEKVLALAAQHGMEDFYAEKYLNTLRVGAETESNEASVYKGYKQDKIEMRGDRAEMSDFPLYLNTVAGGLDRRDQTIGGFSFVVKIYAVPVVEIIG